MARSVAELADDLGEVETQLGSLTRGYVEETDLLQKLSRELRSEVGRARLVPVGQLFGRLRRLLKNSGSRSYQLDLSGENVEIDTLVLEGLTDPLLHLVRNALVHGVEPSELRAALGKTPEGNVSLRAYPLGNTVYIEVEDDGAGIDVAAVKRKAVETGLEDPARGRSAERPGGGATHLFAGPEHRARHQHGSGPRRRHGRGFGGRHRAQG